MAKGAIPRKRLIVTIGVSALALSAVIALSNVLVSTVTASVQESAYDNLMSSTKVIAQSVDSRLNSDFDELINFATGIEAFSQEDMEPVFSLYVDANDFLATYYVDETGIGFSETGEPFSVSDVPVPGMEPDGEPTISSVFHDEAGYTCVLMKAPILDEEGGYHGTVYAKLVPQRYYSENIFAFWEGSGRAFVFNAADGDWIIKAPTSNMLPTRNKTFFDALIAAGNSEAVVEEIKTCAQEGRSGVFEIRNENSSSFICLTPSDADIEWSFATILPADILNKEAEDINLMLRITQIVLVAGLVIVFGGLALYVRTRNQKNLEHIERMHEERTRAQEKRLSEIAMREYDSQTVINLETMQAKTEQYRGTTPLYGQKADTEFAYENIYPRIYDFLDADDAARVAACISPERLLEEYNETLPFAPSARYRIVKDGSTTWMECSVFFSRVDGERFAYLMNKDVTAEATAQQKIERANEEKGRRLVELQRMRDTLQEALNAAESANTAKSRFLSNMSHDIRTPMNAIVGMTAIAANELDNPERVTECLDTIKRSSAHLLDLINDVLDMAMIENGKLVLTSGPFSITDAVDRAVTIADPLRREKNQQMTTHIEIAHDAVIGDMTRLDQVLINLLNNASKFTPSEGSIEFSVTEVLTPAPDYTSYRFVVADNGIGIAQASLDKIFEAFERETDPEIDKIEGTGLGLAISKSIVQAMGGSIDVESEPNVGTTFTVIVSFRIDGEASADPAKNTPDGPAAEKAEADLEGKRFLLVEDHRVNQLIVQKLLGSEGAAIEVADNGKEAVATFEAAEAGYYDAILMDVRMPVMNGYEATQAIRSLDRSDAATIPIVAMTANAFAEDQEIARRSGMDAHVSKPIDLDEIKHILGRLGL